MLTSPNPSKDKCVHCFASTYVKNDLLTEAKTNISQIEILDKQEQKLKKKYHTILKRCAFADDFTIPASIAQGEIQDQMMTYALKQRIPSSVFQVITNNYYSSCFMIQTGLIQLKTKCPQCANKVRLSQNRVLGDFNYICKCGENWNFLDRTPWKESGCNSQKILTIIIMFLIGCRDVEMKKILNIYPRQLSHVTGLVKTAISEHYMKNLPKFRGVVEIDESAFKLKKKLGATRAAEKWVFGLYERERKLVYMEIVKNRLATTLVPIIQKICEPGTTIISDQWASYNKLPDYGFPHYTVDHSRFFVNPHSREIHTQDIEISWGWAKYEIRRQNRCLFDLQKYLHLYCWKRQFKEYQDKVTEVAMLLKAFCEIFKEYQAEEKKDEV